MTSKPVPISLDLAKQLALRNLDFMITSADNLKVPYPRLGFETAKQKLSHIKTALQNQNKIKKTLEFRSSSKYSLRLNLTNHIFLTGIFLRNLYLRLALLFSFAVMVFATQRYTHTNIFSAVHYNSPQYLLSRWMVSLIYSKSRRSNWRSHGLSERLTTYFESASIKSLSCMALQYGRLHILVRPQNCTRITSVVSNWVSHLDPSTSFVFIMVLQLSRIPHITTLQKFCVLL